MENIPPAHMYVALRQMENAKGRFWELMAGLADPFHESLVVVGSAISNEFPGA